jgi:hypothetical protein
VPTSSPAHRFGLEAIDLICGGNGATNVIIRSRQRYTFCRRMRGKRRGVHACAKYCSAGGGPKGKLQKMAAFHDFSFAGRQ